MSDRSPRLRLFAMAVLLLAFVMTARGGLRGAGRVDAAASACERTPPRDAEGLERCLALSPRDVELMLDLGSERCRSSRAPRSDAAASRRAWRSDARAQFALTLQPRSSRALALLERAGWRGHR